MTRDTIKRHLAANGLRCFERTNGIASLSPFSASTKTAHQSNISGISDPSNEFSAVENLGRSAVMGCPQLYFKERITPRTWLLLLAVVVATGWMASASLLPAASITYVQGNDATPQAAVSMVTSSFLQAQAAGDLNVVVVGWHDSTAIVTSVRDSSGNRYLLAVGPTIRNGYLSQAIYYAKSIAPAGQGANAVTVTFSTPAESPDLRILEYRGADPINPVDATSYATGGWRNSFSGNATTSNATDLIFGANTVTSSTAGPGSLFTLRILTSPDGDIAEDRMVTSPGQYQASAPLNWHGRWIMQMVAFRTPQGSSVSGASNIAASPSSLSFGTVAVGSSSTQTVTLSNTGTASVTVTQVTPAGT